MNFKTVIAVLLVVTLLLSYCEAARWRVRIRIRISRSKKRAIQSRAQDLGDDFNFDVPCNLIKFDVNKDSELSLEEFATGMGSNAANVGLREIFVLLDQDGDGTLSVGELDTATKLDCN